MRKKFLTLLAFVAIVLVAVPLIGTDTFAPVSQSSCEFEYQHAADNATPPPATWIYRSNTGDYPQPHNWHYPGYAPKLINNVLDVRTK